MSDVARGEGWWQASDLAWYPPELRPGQQAGAPSRRALPDDAASPPPAPGATRPLPRKAVPRKAAKAGEATPPTTPTEPAARADEVLLELKGSALTSDFNKIGERLHVYADRVEQLGRGNKRRAELALADVLIVEVEKTIKGSWLRIVGDGVEIVQQGLEPGPAAQARELIVRHAPGAVTGEVAEQLRKLLDLRDDGVLSAEEFEAKRRQVLGR